MAPKTSVRQMRGHWEGVTNVVRFNWHFYAIALGALLAAAFMLCLPVLPLLIKTVIGTGAGLAFFYMIISLAVSHFIYDRSDLYRFQWLKEANLPETGHFVNIHSGFDETSLLLKQQFPKATWSILDFYDPALHTEVSIARARRYRPTLPETLAIDANHWVLGSESVDAIFGVLVVHEIRSHENRVTFFLEAHRVLKHKGTLVLVEHLRNHANFLAYGPGFLHFFSRQAWQIAFSMGGFRSMKEFFITPFIRVFILKKEDE